MPVLPEGRVGVYVSQVISDTGAARAGIQQQDVIIGINGQQIVGNGNAISNSFSAMIRELRPGATVELEIVRGQEVMMISATLARPPQEVARNSRIIVVTSLFKVAEERFQQWWVRYFNQDAGELESETAAAQP